LAARLVLTGACPAHAALVRDLGTTRERIRAEAFGCAGPEAFWLEGVEVATRSALDLAALRQRSDSVGLLVRSVEEAGSEVVGEEAKGYCAGLLDRASWLRAALGPSHAAVRAAAGDVPAEVLERARNLLLAQLAED
jgi:hypothetical protein